MSLAYNGNIVATNSPQVTLSEAEWLALPEEQRNDPNINYFIYDKDDNDYQRLVRIMRVVGSEEVIKDLPGGTIISAIKELFVRLNNISFSIDPEFKNVVANYVETHPNNDIPQLEDDATDSEKIAYLTTIMGSTEDLANCGFDTIAGALSTLYGRLGGLGFAYNNEDNPEDDTVSAKDYGI